MTNMHTSRQLTFADDNNDKTSISVTILETFDTSASYGLYLWPCSPILAQYIWYNRNDFIGKNILEIGAGTSLPGLVAAKIGAQNVILCDNPKIDKWLPLIRETMKLNMMIADRICIEFLDWYDEESIDGVIKKYFPSDVDIIIGSDIFFDKKDFETILALLDKLFTYKNSSLKFIGTIERRSRSTILKLNHLIYAWNMTLDIVPLNSFNGDAIHPNIIAGHDIVLFSIVKTTQK
ncbi:unnamed protein product [Rotaria socialis]|uniref:Uncharacterized protein n=2 Tax=Rotaria socialis TaxID=392032 RepID=A0A817WQV8_9BILA|nr:unnamed protein product [Rotaria socialis]CAF3341615.1 unnamed protein product [Rotaria socialis]CAF3358360.1 unnamed protein product [Rotaria socialis]CAF3575920.1 unnamed protein product [Rotaria socialis]CAF4196988.1 unnamed protein product [Rotaria socialis]